MRSVVCRLTTPKIAWTVVALTAVLTAVAARYAAHVKHDDDVFAFLPQTRPEVARFTAINREFGGLDLGLVGIQTDDVYAGPFLERLTALSRALGEIPGVDRVLSLTNVVDFSPDPERGGVINAPLIDEIPRSADESQRLRAKVLTRNHLLGNLVAKDGRGVLIYCYLAHDSDPKQVSAEIGRRARNAFAERQIFLGGGPLVASYIYTTTQREMRCLTPFAVLAVLLVIAVSFRSAICTLLSVIATVAGIVIAFGLMGLFGIRLNLVLAAAPIILFAMGSAYNIHVLSRYQTRLHGSSPRDAAARALSEVGPTVLTAGLTTAAGLVSFLMMDIRPFRVFGLCTSLGVLFTLLLSLTFVPAAASLLRSRARQPKTLQSWIVVLAVGARRRRTLVLAIMLIVTVAGGAFATRVDTRIDFSTFFSKHSPPALADRFLAEHFDGAKFIQLHLKGDLTDPHVLRELQRVADLARVTPGVTTVSHVAQVLAKVNEAMTGQRRLPDTRDQAQLLLALTAGDPSVGQLITENRRAALIHVRTDLTSAVDVEHLVQELEQLLTEDAARGYRLVAAGGAEAQQVSFARSRRLASRIQAILHESRAHLAAIDRTALIRALLVPAPPVDRGDIAASLTRFMATEEFVVPLADAPRARARLAHGLARAAEPGDESSLRRVLAAVLELKDPTNDGLLDDLAQALSTPLAQAWSHARAQARYRSLAASFVLGPLPAHASAQQDLAEQLTSALIELDRASELLPERAAARTAGQLTWEVTGLPIMHRGLSESIRESQVKSLALALMLVAIIVGVVFRSVSTALLVLTPTLVTLTLIFGAMASLGLHIEIGTSLLACLVLGVGVNYGVHLIAEWRSPKTASMERAVARAAGRAGPAIWTNALMVVAGFGVIALGESRVLKNLGALTASATLIAAVVTFVLIPALARRQHYGRSLATTRSPEAPERTSGADE